LEGYSKDISSDMVLNQVDVAVVTHFARVLWKSPSLLVSRLTGKQGEELASLTTTTTTAANFRSRAYLIHTHTQTSIGTKCAERTLGRNDTGKPLIIFEK
jgi:hypothetical protein